MIILIVCIWGRNPQKWSCVLTPPLRRDTSAHPVAGKVNWPLVKVASVKSLIGTVPVFTLNSSVSYGEIHGAYINILLSSKHFYLIINFNFLDDSCYTYYYNDCQIVIPPPIPSFLLHFLVAFCCRMGAVRADPTVRKAKGQVKMAEAGREYQAPEGWSGCLHRLCALNPDH